MIIDVCVYLVVFTFSAILIAFYQRIYTIVRIKRRKNNCYNSKKISTVPYVILGCVFLFPLIAMYGLRYGIGKDYYSYETIYYLFHNASLGEYWIMHKNNIGWYYVEPLYYVLNRIAPSYRILLWIIGILIFALICLALKEYANEISFPLALMVFWSTQFIYSLNGVRFVVALCFVFNAYIALSNDNIARFLVLIVIATFFHKSVILCAAMFFLKEFRNKRVNTIRNCMLIVLVFVFPIIANYLLDIISLIPIFSRYFSSETYAIASETKSGVMWLFHFLPVILPLVLFCRKEIMCSDNTKLFLRIAVLEIPFRSLGLFNRWFARYSRCAQIIQVILVPMVLARIEDKRKKMLLTIYYIAWYIFYFAYYAIAGDQGESLPYVWVFSNI